MRLFKSPPPIRQFIWTLKVSCHSSIYGCFIYSCERTILIQSRNLCRWYIGQSSDISSHVKQKLSEYANVTNPSIHGVKSKAPPKYFQEKTMKLSMYLFKLVIFMKLDKVVTIYSKPNFDSISIKAND